MANDKFEKDPFDKYDYLFEEQEKKYQKQNNSRYKLTKAPKKITDKEPINHPKPTDSDQKAVYRMFIALFASFAVIGIAVSNRFTFWNLVIPAGVIGFIIYSYNKNSK
jgi:hypothetical protein